MTKVDKMSGRYPIDYGINGSSKSDQYFIYAEVYKQAIELNLEQFSVSPPIHSHSLTPVVFLLRQYIELQLKGIIAFGEDHHEVQITHKIQYLYEQAIKNVEQNFGLERLRETNPEVNKFILCMSRFDPRGQAFRFPENSKGDDFSELIGGADLWLYEKVTVLDGFKDITAKTIRDMENIEAYLQCMNDGQQESWTNNQ
jgi:hypothetical protein